MTSSSSPGPRIKIDNRLLTAAEILAGAGAVLWLGGVILAGAAGRRALQQWVEQLDQPVGDLAKAKWQQLVIAKEAGTHAWKHGSSYKAS